MGSSVLQKAGQLRTAVERLGQCFGSLTRPEARSMQDGVGARGLEAGGEERRLSSPGGAQRRVRRLVPRSLCMSDQDET